MVRTFENLSQRKKTFIEFIPKFTCFINDVTYTDNQSKIDLFSIKLLDKMN